MESSVEYNYLWCACWDNCLAGSQCKSVWVVMYRCKLRQCVDLVDNFVCYKAGLLEYLSTLNYSVTNG